MTNHLKDTNRFALVLFVATLATLAIPRSAAADYDLGPIEVIVRQESVSVVDATIVKHTGEGHAELELHEVILGKPAARAANAGPKTLKAVWLSCKGQPPVATAGLKDKQRYLLVVAGDMLFEATTVWPIVTEGDKLLVDYSGGAKQRDDAPALPEAGRHELAAFKKQLRRVAGQVEIHADDRAAVIALDDARLEFDDAGHVVAADLTGRFGGTGDERLKLLRGLAHLRSLTVGSSQITDDGLASLADLRALQTLTLSSAPLKGSGLRHLRGLTKLTHLGLAHTQLDDDALPLLAELPALERVDLRGTKVTAAGAEKLSKARPKIEVLLK